MDKFAEKIKSTKSQSGLMIFWGGSLLTWRSSRAHLSALSTAEAELTAAATGWQVTEGIRYLLGTLGINLPVIDMHVDNKAALHTAELGSTWRTRYFQVRANRLLEESTRGRVRLHHCPTKAMIADTIDMMVTMFTTKQTQKLIYYLPIHVKL